MESSACSIHNKKSLHKHFQRVRGHIVNESQNKSLLLPSRFRSLSILRLGDPLLSLRETNLVEIMQCPMRLKRKLNPFFLRPTAFDDFFNERHSSQSILNPRK